ncbi:MAG: ROK family protein [Pyrinomonadaceae bacterium]
MAGINTNNDVVIAVDLGGTNLRTAMVDQAGGLHHRNKHSTPRDNLAHAIVNALAASINECIAADEGRSKVVAISIAIPGTVHTDLGTVMNAPNLPCLNGFDLASALRTAIGHEVRIENDANAAAVGELWQGAARSVKSMLIFTLGTGVGGGIVLDGKLWRGIDGTAGELGHIGVVYDGPPCGCGSRGCVEQFASATAIVRQTRELAGTYPASSLPQEDPLTAQKVYLAGCAGDELAIEVFHRLGRYLGMAMATMVDVFNPEMIVVAGGVAAGWDLFIESVRAEIKARTFPEPGRRVQVVRALCGDDAGLFGAAQLAFSAAKTIK